MDREFIKGALDDVKRMLIEHPRLDLPDIPRFEILERLGEGAAATVYRARDKELNRDVALKILHPDVDRERFLREAKLAASLSHPNLVTVHDAGEAEGIPYLVMELVEGETFQPNRKDAVTILQKAALGVAAAHERGIVHRDLKPGNILVKDEPKVGDFGLAFVEGSSTRLTRTGAAVGTPLYMAPEQVKSEKIGPPADVHALGAILYEILTGRPPFTAETAMAIYRRIVEEDPEPPEAPTDVRTICMKALEKRPADRYPDAGAFAEDLRRYLAGEPILARPSGAMAHARKWIMRHPTVVAVTVVVLLALGVILMLPGEKVDPAQQRILTQKWNDLQAQIADWDGADVSDLIREYDRLKTDKRYRDAELVLDQAMLTIAVDRKMTLLKEHPEAAEFIRQADREPSLARKHAILNRGIQVVQAGTGALQAKMKRVQQRMREVQQSGRNPHDLVGKLLKEFDEHLRRGRRPQAEVVLDRILQRLDGDR